MPRQSSKAMARAAVVGVHRAGKPTSPAASAHAVGFGQALENAVLNATETFYPGRRISPRNPREIKVTVTFEATAKVHNPGVIDEYRAIITEVP